MKKRRLKALGPEQLAKYQEWLKTAPRGEGEIQYFREGEEISGAIADLSEEQLASYRQFLASSGHGGELEFEEFDDEGDLPSPRAREHAASYDVVTKYLLDHGYVVTRRQGWMVQVGILSVPVTIYLFWFYVFQ